MVQLSHLYMTTGKSIALTRRTFVGKVMPQLFNMLSRFVIAFLPRIKCFCFVLFCFVFNFVAAVTICSDFATLENKVSVSIVSPSICHEVMGPDAIMLAFEC